MSKGGYFGGSTLVRASLYGGARKKVSKASSINGVAKAFKAQVRLVSTSRGKADAFRKQLRAADAEHQRSQLLRKRRVKLRGSEVAPDI